MNVGGWTKTNTDRRNSSVGLTRGSSWAMTRQLCSGYGGKNVVRSSRRTCQIT